MAGLLSTRAAFAVTSGLIFVMAGCATSGSGSTAAPPGPPPERIAGTRWALVSLAGSLPTGDEPLTVEFAADGKASGYSGVNRFFGGYQSAENQPGRGSLRFSELACTKKAGPDPLMKQEAEYLMELQRADAYVAEGGLLEMESAGAPRLRFRKMSAAPP